MFIFLCAFGALKLSFINIRRFLLQLFFFPGFSERNRIHQVSGKHHRFCCYVKFLYRHDSDFREEISVIGLFQYNQDIQAVQTHQVSLFLLYTVQKFRQHLNTLKYILGNNILKVSKGLILVSIKIDNITSQQESIECYENNTVL